jgi:hypothetical protein
LLTPKSTFNLRHGPLGRRKVRLQENPQGALAIQAARSTIHDIRSSRHAESSRAATTLSGFGLLYYSPIEFFRIDLEKAFQTIVELE